MSDATLKSIGTDAFLKSVGTSSLPTILAPRKGTDYVRSAGRDS